MDMVVIGGAELQKQNKSSTNTKHSAYSSALNVKKTQDNQTVQENVTLPEVTRDMITA